MIKQRRDANEAEIIQALKAAGASVKQMDRLAGFDLLVAYDGRLMVMEVKSNRDEKLTSAEELYKRELQYQDVWYMVVYTPEQALEFLRLVEEAKE